MTSRRDVQRSRAVQVGFVLRSYRESYIREDGRRGLTQDELLAKMGDVAENFAQRFSHTTVSRWESGLTRPTAERLTAFGRALDLSDADIAGLILLAGLAPHFDDASDQARSLHRPSEVQGSVESHSDLQPDYSEVTADGGSSLRELAGFWAFRFLPLGLFIAGLGYALSFLDWNGALMPVLFVGLVVSVVLAQGFIVQGSSMPLREFFWVSIFFLLSTPLLEFAPLLMDHYNFYVIEGLGGTAIPYPQSTEEVSVAAG